MTPDRGEYLIAFDIRLSITVRIFSAVTNHDHGGETGVERDHPRDGRELLLAQHAADDVGQRDRTERGRFERARLVVREEILDQLLQRQCVLAHDAHDLVLLRRQPAADVVAQELRALAHGSERRLELVRHVAQEPRLLLLELVQARTQPFEPLADVAQVLRTVHFDCVSEIGRAHLADRLVELANRTRDEHGEDNRQRQRNRDGSERQVEPFLASLRRGLLQALDRTLRKLRRGIEHPLRILDQIGVAVGELGHDLRRALRRIQELVQPVLALAQLVKRHHVGLIERKQ